MKKKYIQLGAIAFVLLALTGALLLLRNAPEVSDVEPESEPSETVYIYGDVSTEGIAPKQIDISNEYGDITIDNITPEGETSAKYTIRGWENLSLDDYTLAQPASYAKAMIAKEIISENATSEELKTFGFDEPRASVTVHLADGGAPVIIFGSNAPGGEGVYVMRENDNRIYLISDSAALPYFKPGTAYVDKTITADDPEFKIFDKLTLSGTNYPEEIVIERTPESEVEAAGITMNSHAITSPIKRGLDTQKGLEPLSSVYGLLANDVVAVDDSIEALEKYGLKDPAAIVSVAGDTPEMTFTLRISDADENGEVHLIKDGSKVIYELSPSALPFLPLSMFDMMNKVVAIPNIQSISSVTVGTEEKGYYTFDITQEDEASKLIVTVNGEPLPDAVDEDGKAVDAGENFRKLYQTMIICRYNEPMPEAEAGGDAVLTEADTGFGEAEGAEADNAETASSEAGAAPLESEDDKARRIGGIRYDYNNGTGSDYVYFYEGPPRKMEIRLYHSDHALAQPITLVESGYYGQTIYMDRLFEDLEKVLNGVAVSSYL